MVVPLIAIAPIATLVKNRRHYRLERDRVDRWQIAEHSGCMAGGLVIETGNKKSGAALTGTGNPGLAAGAESSRGQTDDIAVDPLGVMGRPAASRYEYPGLRPVR